METNWLKAFELKQCRMKYSGFGLKQCQMKYSRRPCLQNRSQLNMRLKMASNLPVFMNIFSAKQMLVLRRKSWGSNRWQYIMLSHFSKR